MAITYPIADADLVEKLNLRLEEFRKLRVGYIDPSLSEEEKQEEMKKVEQVEQKKPKKRSLLEKFFFSEYE